MHHKIEGDPTTTVKILSERLSDAIYGSEESFTFIIKGHLFVEALLTAVIKYGHLAPEVLQIERLAYDSKISVCIASGLIHEEVGPVARNLGKIRNGFAHNLWYSFSKKEERDFLNVLRQSPRLSKKLAVDGKQQYPQATQKGIYILCMYLLEQLIRTASKRNLLSEFWSEVVDSETPPAPSLVDIIGPLTENEMADLFGEENLARIKMLQKDTAS